MGNIPFIIVFSNYTGRLFAWGGIPHANKKYLGNREILGTVKARNPQDALSQWQAQKA